MKSPLQGWKGMQASFCLPGTLAVALFYFQFFYLLRLLSVDMITLSGTATWSRLCLVLWNPYLLFVLLYKWDECYSLLFCKNWSVFLVYTVYASSKIKIQRLAKKGCRSNVLQHLMNHSCPPGILSCPLPWVVLYRHLRTTFLYDRGSTKIWL